MKAQNHPNQEPVELNTNSVKVAPTAINLDARQKESSLKIFNYYDLDKNGEISKEELKIMLEGFREAINENEVNRFFQEYDIDASDFLDFSEFLEVVKYKLVKEANKLASSKSISFHFDKEELEILVQYLDIVIFSKGDQLNILDDNQEGALIILSSQSKAASDPIKKGISFNNLKHKNFEAKNNGIAIKLEETKIKQLVMNHPLVALKLNQSLDSKLSTMMAKFV